MRTKMESVRVKQNLSKREVARRAGTNPQTILFLEQAKRNGSIVMWKKLQNVYGISDADMWAIITEHVAYDDK